VPVQPVRTLWHARQCLAVDGGLLAPELCRRAVRRQRMDGQGLRPPCAARRVVGQPSRLRALRRAQRRGCRPPGLWLFEPCRIPRRAESAVSEIPSSLERWEREPAIADVRRRYVVENGPGLLASALLHGLALLLVLVAVRTAVPPAREQLKTVLVDIIHLGAETSSPPAPRKSVVPQSQAFARRAATAHSPPVGVKPAKTPTKDDFQNRLNALAKLRAPETSTRALAGPGDTDTQENTSSDSPGGDATYSLRDYVRAQVMRRWNLDLD